MTERPEVMPYSPTKSRMAWRPFVLGVLATPMLYLLLYTLLRVFGVFSPYYSQGSWEIEGGTGIALIDIPFLPAAIAEAELQNRLRWLDEPTGG